MNGKGVWSYLFLVLHEFGRFGRVDRIQKLCHDDRELFELNGLRDVGVEACLRTFGVDIAKNIGRQGNDGYTSVSVFLFPASNLFACLVSVFVRHMQIALSFG
jgi:hypothetical protein